ncbi:hypothetical protein RUM43_004368 [Polyplax serrata]|uniref:Uncharacterized protein n=1 Tax=Polyplax serrata TaxID=468196 RepID=A0AAN8XN20_POLSC
MNEIQNSVNARGEVGKSSLYEAPPCPTSPRKTKRRIVGVSAREEANSDEDNKAHDHETTSELISREKNNTNEKTHTGNFGSVKSEVDKTHGKEVVLGYN